MREGRTRLVSSDLAAPHSPGGAALPSVELHGSGGRRRGVTAWASDAAPDRRWVGTPARRSPPRGRAETQSHCSGRPVSRRRVHCQRRTVARRRPGRSLAVLRGRSPTPRLRRFGRRLLVYDDSLPCSGYVAVPSTRLTSSFPERASSLYRRTHSASTEKERAWSS